MGKFFGKWVLSIGLTAAFPKLVGTCWVWKCQILSSAHGDRGLLKAEERLVCNHSSCEFPGGQNKENEVRGEGWLQTLKDTGQLFFKVENSAAHIALEKFENCASTYLIKVAQYSFFNFIVVKCT